MRHPAHRMDCDGAASRAIPPASPEGKEACRMKPNFDRAGISLRDVLTSARFVQTPDVRVTACCTSPDECNPGDLFVAVTAANSDGHDWADEAVRRGASAVLAERLLPVAGPQVVVEDSRE